MRPVESMSERLRRRLREHVALTVVFVLSRIGLALAGVRLNFELAWMFLADPGDLENRLSETLLYFHAYPPGMNLVTGLVLKAGGSHAALLGELLYGSLGLVLVNSLFFGLRVLAISERVAFAVAIVFSLTPPVIYLEHLWLWEEFVAALLAFAAALFYRALKRPSFGGWLGFFSACSAVGWFRSSFQLSWLIALLGLALWLSLRAERRRVLLAAAGPLALLLALHLKNWALFGVFGASSAGGGNLTHVTVSRLPRETREAWVRSGKISPLAAHSVYAGPSEYLAFFDPKEARRFPEVSVVQALERPSLRLPNYNHWVFLEVNRRRAEDAFAYLREKPFDYFSTVLDGLRQFFGPTTRWHPFDKTERSPHHAQRAVLGRYERFFNGAVHRFPFAGVGVYVFLPVGLIWAAGWARARVRTRVRERRARLGLVLFALFQIAYVTGTSMLFTIGESSRYRYQIEAQIWLLSAFALVGSFSARQKRKRTALTAS